MLHRPSLELHGVPGRGEGYGVIGDSPVVGALSQSCASEEDVEDELTLGGGGSNPPG